MNVWDIKSAFETTGQLPELSDVDRKIFLEFAKIQVSDSIEAYERYTYNHGGLRQEAKDMLADIGKAENLVKVVEASING